MKAQLILGGVMVLMLSALPALAAPAGEAPDPLAAIFAASPDGACALPMASKPGLPGGVGEASTCTAHCWDGSTRTCTGTSCTAVDSSCSSQRGYCWSNSEGYKYCPTCQASCTASCANAGGGSVSCTSTTGDYYCLNNCYAYCDGQYHLCPHIQGSCPF
jgi:hypothetical protein